MADSSLKRSKKDTPNMITEKGRLLSKTRTQRHSESVSDYSECFTFFAAQGPF